MKRKTKISRKHSHHCCCCFCYYWNNCLSAWTRRSNHHHCSFWCCCRTDLILNNNLLYETVKMHSNKWNNPFYATITIEYLIPWLRLLAGFCGAAESSHSSLLFAVYLFVFAAIGFAAGVYIQSKIKFSKNQKHDTFSNFVWSQIKQESKFNHNYTHKIVIPLVGHFWKRRNFTIFFLYILLYSYRIKYSLKKKITKNNMKNYKVYPNDHSIWHIHNTLFDWLNNKNITKMLYVNVKKTQYRLCPSIQIVHRWTVVCHQLKLNDWKTQPKLNVWKKSDLSLKLGGAAHLQIPLKRFLKNGGAIKFGFWTLECCQTKDIKQDTKKKIDAISCWTRCHWFETEKCFALKFREMLTLLTQPKFRYFEHKFEQTRGFKAKCP